jgi:hypothetical protein
VAEVYHRTAAGKVTWVDALTRDEVEAAVARAGWEWSFRLAALRLGRRRSCAAFR